MRAHEIADAALPGRAVVLGSLPPGGRDLDLLVEPAHRAPVEAALRAAGFEGHEGGWLRFAHRTAELVELVDPATLGLPEDERRALFDDARMLEGCARLARPAPWHVVLILARKAAAEGALTERRRARLEAALAEDPGARAEAERRAAAWGARLGALDRAAPADDAPAGGLLPSGVRARLGAGRDRALGRRRGAVIALSGLDGSGKSTQAQALSDALERLGYDVAIEWTRFGFNDRFWDVALRAKELLTRLLRPGGTKAPDDDPVRAIRQRSELLTQLWALAITLENVWSQWRLTSGFLARGYVVICDRYTLDSIVSLRYLVDQARPFRVQRLLLRLLTRRPSTAYLLEVAPETAWERKGEHGLPWLRAHHRLYREEHERLGVVRLDGERPAEELAARIAAETFAALGRR